VVESSKEFYGAPLVKTSYLRDLAQKLLSLEIFISLRAFSYLCTHFAISARINYLCTHLAFSVRI